jgi:hypothetical protein
MSEKKKAYEKPAVRKVELKLQEAVLADCKNWATGPAISDCAQTGCNEDNAS